MSSDQRATTYGPEFFFFCNHMETTEALRQDLKSLADQVSRPLVVGELLTDGEVELPTGEPINFGLSIAEMPRVLDLDLVRSLVCFDAQLNTFHSDYVRASRSNQNTIATRVGMKCVAAVYKANAGVINLAIRAEHYENFSPSISFSPPRPNFIVAMVQRWLDLLIRKTVPSNYADTVVENIWNLVQLCPTAALAFPYLIVENTGHDGFYHYARRLQHRLIRIHLWAGNERKAYLEEALKDAALKEKENVERRMNGIVSAEASGTNQTTAPATESVTPPMPAPKKSSEKASSKSPATATKKARKKAGK
ncbi:hypothetical protein GGR53DRAFT_469162 [Hypoxylon sp. FL1150]|nr:hypothetical protein GGR53DRAFT_469162 [Hypoxylon sp. FL1150]